MKLVHAAVILALFTASFDSILALQAGGTVRITQIFMLFIFVAAFWQILHTRTILWPHGGTALALWMLVQALLIGRSSIQFISIQLYVLLLFAVLVTFALVQLYGRSDRIQSLMKGYVLSFVFVAAFGIFQFVTPALHLGHWLTKQWILYGVIPRVSAFSYEPSFYVTYMIVGWIMLVDLRLSDARIVRGTRWRWITVLVTVALIVSTSKTAYVCILLEVASRLFPGGRRLAGEQLRRLSVGSLVVRLPSARLLAYSGLALLGVVLVFGQISKLVNLTIFLAGTGISNTSNQSLEDRLNSLAFTRQVVVEHPLVGLSLGGVSGRVAQLQGTEIQSMNDLRLHWASPVPLEVLAAGGILGTLPFLWFFFSISLGEYPLMRRHPDDDRSKWLHSMIRAMFFQWLCLCADQNLVRWYVWYHFALLVTVGYNLRYYPGAALSTADPERAVLLVREPQLSLPEPIRV